MNGFGDMEVDSGKNNKKVTAGMRKKTMTSAAGESRLNEKTMSFSRSPLLHEERVWAQAYSQTQSTLSRQRQRPVPIYYSERSVTQR